MEPTTISGFSALISQVGFPIFVAVWMLFKSSRDSENIVKALNELQTTIKILQEQIKGGSEK